MVDDSVNNGPASRPLTLLSLSLPPSRFSFSLVEMGKEAKGGQAHTDRSSPRWGFQVSAQVCDSQCAYGCVCLSVLAGGTQSGRKLLAEGGRVCCDRLLHSTILLLLAISRLQSATVK